MQFDSSIRLDLLFIWSEQIKIHTFSISLDLYNIKRFCLYRWSVTIGDRPQVELDFLSAPCAIFCLYRIDWIGMNQCLFVVSIYIGTCLISWCEKECTIKRRKNEWTVERFIETKNIEANERNTKSRRTKNKKKSPMKWHIFGVGQQKNDRAIFIFLLKCYEFFVSVSSQPSHTTPNSISNHG